jgi:hypothetical protein
MGRLVPALKTTREEKIEAMASASRNVRIE